MPFSLLNQPLTQQEVGGKKLHIHARAGSSGTVCSFQCCAVHHTPLTRSTRPKKGVMYGIRNRASPPARYQYVGNILACEGTTTKSFTLFYISLLFYDVNNNTNNNKNNNKKRGVCSTIIAHTNDMGGRGGVVAKISPGLRGDVLHDSPFGDQVSPSPPQRCYPIFNLKTLSDTIFTEISPPVRRQMLYDIRYPYVPHPGTFLRPPPPLPHH